MKTRYAYDTEFIEDGSTIDLISIAIVAEDGREYYAVNADMPIDRIREHDWLMQNVVPFLPMVEVPALGSDTIVPIPDTSNLQVKPHSRIAQEVLEFLAAGEHEPELWAFFGAYDHVVYAQLWGPMAELPGGLPMRTRDIADALDTFDGWDERPRQDEGTAHDALEDARNVMATLRYIDEVARPRWLQEALEATTVALHEVEVGPQRADGFSSKKVTLKATVEGEAVYEISHAVLDSQIAQFKDDLFDYTLNDLTMRLRKYRKTVVYGTCSEEGCSLSRTPNPLITGSTQCAPHDRQEFITSDGFRHA